MMTKRVNTIETTVTMNEIPIDLITTLFRTIDSTRPFVWFKWCIAFSLTAQRYRQLWLSFFQSNDEWLKAIFSRYGIAPTTLVVLCRMAIDVIRPLLLHEYYTTMALNTIPSLMSHVALYDKIIYRESSRHSGLELIRAQKNHLSLAQRLRLVAVWNEFDDHSRSLDRFVLSKPGAHSSYCNLYIYNGEYHNTANESYIEFENHWLDMTLLYPLSEMKTSIDPINLFAFASRAPTDDYMNRMNGRNLTTPERWIAHNKMKIQAGRELVEMSLIDYRDQPEIDPVVALKLNTIPINHHHQPLSVGHALETILPGERGRVQFPRMW